MQCVSLNEHAFQEDQQIASPASCENVRAWHSLSPCQSLNVVSFQKTCGKNVETIVLIEESPAVPYKYTRIWVNLTLGRGIGRDQRRWGLLNPLQMTSLSLLQNLNNYKGEVELLTALKFYFKDMTSPWQNYMKCTDERRQNPRQHQKRNTVLHQMKHCFVITLEKFLLVS